MRPYRELTIASLVFGVLLGVLMTASFVYIALKLGFSLGGSTVAAILGFAVLRGVLRNGTILENRDIDKLSNEYHQRLNLSKRA